MLVATIGITILVIALAGAILWARRAAPGQPRQMKVLLFFLYFWLLAFVQMIIVAIVYSVMTG